jgi:MYXO-CTERM domain-containing protein
MRKLLAGGALAMALSFGAVHPAFAQTTTTEPVSTVQTDDDSNSGKWGLLGLVGLLGLGGLAGLKRRGRDDVTVGRDAGATRVP